MDSSAGISDDHDRASFEFMKVLSSRREPLDDESPLFDLVSTEEAQASFTYRVWATFIQVIVFAIGLIGTGLFYVVIWKAKNLRTSTHRYLVSLASANLVILLSAVPESLVSHHIGDRWITGPVGCAAMVFTNQVGVNAASLCIMALTVDQFVIICRPGLAAAFSNWKFALKIVLCLWIFSGLYCSPWVGLAKVTIVPAIPTDYASCNLKLSAEQYLIWFLCDLAFFYFSPVLVAAGTFTFLWMTLKRRLQQHLTAPSVPWSPELQAELMKNIPGQETIELNERINQGFVNGGNHPSFCGDISLKALYDEGRSNLAVLRMLIVILAVFTLTWLPLRILLVYNSFAAAPWYNVNFLFFGKTCIYANCAVLPYLCFIVNGQLRKATATALNCNACGR
ncbi:putative Thyrotropin-releasing hormone receptor [Hypsibius exemplaris]|uniref:Thyrotropin-releasing hormone receptor n=1 Tax=Hypsibius exemplaris TaxID=2072580 RepID=A0A1W0WEA5_HYPEX|nr:putative Thyrotropin-releasing hormone receptor [Hypsibius exemplaris]